MSSVLNPASTDQGRFCPLALRSTLLGSSEPVKQSYTQT